MKNGIHIIFFLALAMINRVSAQTTYNITTSGTYSALGLPATCNTCTFNISNGVKLTINSNITLREPAFNGGSVEINNSTITVTSSGTKSAVLNNTSFVVKASNIVTNRKLVLTNTSMIFSLAANILLNKGLDMNNSSMNFLDNSFFRASTSIITMSNGSTLLAGDGSTSSTAYIRFDTGAILALLDTSKIMIANYNNAYINLDNYFAILANFNILSFTTTNLNMNCGTPGKNACSVPNVYGPATLSISGVSSNAILPVKLTDFSVKYSGNNVEVSWTTDMEYNADRYEIERSIDGMHWSAAGKVKAKGNSSTQVKYNFTEILKISGTVSYRLKMIDQDETFAYSPVKKLTTDAAIEMSIFPNPATDYIVISSKKGFSGTMNIQLINQNGQVLKQVKGTGNVNLSVNEFNTGNYFVRVSDTNNASQSFKLLIRK